MTAAYSTKPDHQPAPAVPGSAGEIPQTDLAGLNAEQAVDRLVARAVAMGASDLFLNADEHHVVAEVRHLGLVRQIATLPRELGKRSVAYVRNNSGMNMGDARQPDEGRWIWTPRHLDADDNHDKRLESDDSVDLRVSVIPTLWGEDAAFRLLVRSSTLYGLERLGMHPKQLSQYRTMLANPGGIILFTGPTGSGKTATLYASLMGLNDGSRKINTIEDPVEYAVEGLRQSQVNHDIGLGFPELLRAILRQNPDVIMVGEVRDAETALTAARAANSGILVLATLHAPGTASAIQTLRAFGIGDHALANSLRGVVAQRLVRTLDPESRQAIDLGTDAFEEVRHLLEPGHGDTLYAPVPTPDNHMTGYVGRSGVFEVMDVTKTLRGLIAAGAPAAALREQALKDGMLEFRKAALLKVARGETSTEEVFRTIPGEELLLDD